MTLQERTGWVVVVEDEAGHTGYGEAAPLPGFGMEDPGECEKVLTHWRDNLPGREVNLPAGRGAEALPAFGMANEFPSARAARHGLELALLDLVSLRKGIPLAKWLHPEALDTVPVNATLGLASPTETIDRAQQLMLEGFTTLKIKMDGADSETQISRIKALRQGIGDGIKIRVDANGSWTEEQALDLLEQLAPLGIEYVEQPLPAKELKGMARLTQESPILIAADESACSLAQAKRVLEAGAASLIIAKPMALGGVLTTLSLVRLASETKVPVVITTTLEGVYARLGAAHCAAAAKPIAGSQLPLYAHGLATGRLLRNDHVPNPPQSQQGNQKLTAAPGLGANSPEEDHGAGLN